VIRLRPVRPAGWWPDAVLVAAFVAVTLALAGGAFLGWDLAVASFVDAHRPPAVDWVLRAGNRLGQGGYLAELALVLGILLGWRRHSVRPVLPVAVAFVLTFGTLTPLKYWADRAAPHAHDLTHPERFGSGGVSYPSGHLTNAIVWYGVLALLLAAWLPVAWRRVVRVVPPAVLCVTTVYLGFHWLTDTVAGLLLGLLLDRIMRRVPWDEVPLGSRLRKAGWDRPAVEGQNRPAAERQDRQAVAG
jgi:membrane-associated phospholipid phosphatase